MWSKRRTRSRRGGILTAAYFLTMLAALSAVWMVATLRDHQMSNTKKRQAANAYFAAESAIELVKNWGNNPDHYHSSTVTSASLFYRTQLNEFPNLSSLTVTVNVPASKLLDITNSDGDVLATMESIHLVPKSASDPVDCHFKVVAVGQSPDGSERTVTNWMRPTPLQESDVKLPAALISLNTIGAVGNGTVHWGESWSKGNMDLVGKSHLGHLVNGSANHDQWAKYKTEGVVNFDSTWTIGDGGDVYDVNNTTAMYDPGKVGDPAASPPVPGASGDYEDAFTNNIPTTGPNALAWPDFPSLYDTMKTMAKDHGRYYTTDSKGDIYKDGVQVKKFTDEFVYPAGSRATEPYDLVFIDTIDQQPPKADGSNLATVGATNSIPQGGLKGVFYVCANFKLGGAGEPLPGAERPDETTEDLSAIFMDGVIYTAGELNVQGGLTIYGCAVAENGFTGNGTPDIWYNHRLKDGLPISQGNVGSAFLTVQHQTIGGDHAP